MSLRTTQNIARMLRVRIGTLPYFAGDGAVQAEDGYYRILGRVDDVIKVAGHRLGTKALENAALTTEAVSEAAAIAVIDELRGHLPVIYASLKPGYTPSKEIEQQIVANIARELGRSPSRRLSISSPTFQRPGPGKSCVGYLLQSQTQRNMEMLPRSQTLKSSKPYERWCNLMQSESCETRGR